MVENTVTARLQRIVILVFAGLFIFAISSIMAPNFAGAAQVTSRKITIDSSAASTATTYRLSFTVPSGSATTQELIVDFCANSPIIGDTCTFSAATVPTVASPVASTGTATAIGTGTPVHTIKVTGLSMAANATVNINFTSGVTNPTTATSFYARVVTYTTAQSAGTYSPANVSGNTASAGTHTDDGGIALTTANNINITSKVFETLSFCIFSGSCGTPPSLTLGDSTTGALSVASAYVNSGASYTLATNAGSGVSVTMSGTTLCRQASCATGASANTISAIGAAELVSSVGTEQFGMCAKTAGATGTLAAVAPYADSINACNSGLTTGTYSGTSKFGFDDNASTGTTSTGGDQVLSSTGNVPSYTGTFSFLGNIASSTEAGIYTTSLNMVATGTF